MIRLYRRRKWLHCRSAMTRYLVQIWKIRLSYSDKESLLFDEDASGAFLRTKLHLNVAASHAWSIGQPLCMAIVSVVGANSVPHNWEIFEKYSCKRRTLEIIAVPMQHSAKTKCSYWTCASSKRLWLVSPPPSSGNYRQDKKGIITDDEQGPSQKVMLTDHNLLAFI